MIEGSGPGSVPPTNGSGSGKITDPMDPDPENWFPVSVFGNSLRIWKYMCMKVFLKNYLHTAPPLVKREVEGGVGGSNCLVGVE